MLFFVLLHRALQLTISPKYINADILQNSADKKLRTQAEIALPIVTGSIFLFMAIYEYVLRHRCNLPRLHLTMKGFDHVIK